MSYPPIAVSVAMLGSTVKRSTVKSWFTPGRGSSPEPTQDDDRSSSDIRIISQDGSVSSARDDRPRFVVAIDYGTTQVSVGLSFCQVVLFVGC